MSSYIDAQDGHAKTVPTLKPWPVYNGFLVVRAQWIRDSREGWDEIWDAVSQTIYPSEADALAEIERINGRA